MYQYKGRINFVKGSYGFISAASVTRMDGSPPTNPIVDDIFVSQYECDVPLSVGLELSFVPMTDHEREGALRAGCIVPAGVELHFAETVVDHPTIPITWCLAPEMLALIAKDPKQEWYLAIVAQPHGEGEFSSAELGKTVFMTVNGVARIGDSRGYLTFDAPGTYDVVIYLIRSFDRGDYLRKRHKKFERERIDIWSNRSDRRLSTDAHDLGFTDAGRERNDQVVAYNFASVSVPDEVFAKPLGPAMKAWLGYFKLDKPKDECATRKSVPFALIAGPPLFLVWETFKRVWMLILGVLFFIFGGDPRPVWKTAFRLRLSATLSTWRGEYEWEDMTSWTGWRLAFFPLWWFLAGGLALLWEGSPTSRPALSVTGIVLIFLGAIVLLVYFFGDRVSRRLSENREERERRETQALVSRIETYAVCGRAPVRRPVTVRLLYSGVKRALCRTYSR